MEKKKITFNYFFYYFIVIAFLFPRGYGEYNSLYHLINTILVWTATICIWIKYFVIIKKNTFLIKDNKSIFYYFIYILLITVVLRGFSINGLQKIICYPSIFLFVLYSMKENSKLLLSSICNVMLINLLLNYIVLRSFFATQFHMTFLGHVQLISQFELIAIVSSLLYSFLYKKSYFKSFVIVLLSIITMFNTDATTAGISLTVLIFMFLVYFVRMYHFLRFNSKLYVTLGFLLSCFIIYFSVRNNLVFNNATKILDFNGRSFVWISALESIKKSFIFGYGIEGTLLKVFWNIWTNPSGFNYTHNQIIQNLLDGGLIGLFLYWKMVYKCIDNINKIDEKKYKVILNSILVIFLLIMIVESVSLYCYFYIFLAIAFSFYECTNFKEKENIDGITKYNKI